MDSIAQWITEHITEPLQQMIIDAVNAYVITFLNDLVDVLTGTMTHEIELAKSLLENSYFTTAVHYSQGIAITLLGVRIAFEAFQTYISYSSGEESHPGDLLKKTASATAIIASVPWIVKQTFVFAFSIVDDIQGFIAVPDVTTVEQVISTLVFIGTNAISLPIALLIIGGLLLWLFVLIQMAVRVVNVGVLMVIGPWLWAMKNELGGSWFKSLLSQCLVMPVQMFMLRGALGGLAGTVTSPVLNGMLFVGFMWAALKFPAFLQQLVSQTGVGGTIGGTAQHVGTMVLVRKMMARG